MSRGCGTRATPPSVPKSAGKPPSAARRCSRLHGHDYARIIAPISANVETTLPANFFHFVFTHYVLEHVADIDAVTREIARVTAPGGCGFHVYPGKLRPIEPHLFMPLVHWLPKNLSRKWMIGAFVACGIEPRWGWLAEATRGRKTQAYYEFCNNETFYRSFRDVRRSFNEKGFAVTPVAAPPIPRCAASAPCPPRCASDWSVGQ